MSVANSKCMMPSDVKTGESLILVTEDDKSEISRDYGSKNVNSDAQKALTEANSTENHDKKERIRKFIVIAVINIISFFEWMAFFALVPFYPNEARVKYGLSRGTIGWIIAVFPMAQLISSYLAGVFMTRIGVKRMFCGGSFLNSASVIAFGFVIYSKSSTVFICTSIVLRITMALGLGFTTATAATVIVTLLPVNINTTVGLLESVISLGCMLGPVIAGALYDASGFEVPFIVLGSFGMVFFIASLVFVPVMCEVEKSPYSPFESFKLLRSCSVLTATLVIMAQGIFFGFIEPSIAIYLKQYYRLSSTMIGMLFLIASLIYVVMGVPFGLLMDHVDISKICLVIGISLNGLSTLEIGESPIFGVTPGHHLWLPVCGFAVAGISLITATVPAPGIMKSYTITRLGYPDDIHINGLIASLFLVADSTGYVIGPVLGGYMAEGIGFPWSCTVVGLSLMTLGILTVIINSTCGGWKTPKIDTTETPANTNRETIIENGSKKETT